MSDSQSDEDGVIGYHATTVTPAIMQPDGRRRVAFDQDLAGRWRSSARRGTPLVLRRWPGA